MVVLFYTRSYGLKPDEDAALMSLENGGHEVRVLNGKFFQKPDQQGDLCMSAVSRVLDAYSAIGVDVKRIGDVEEEVPKAQSDPVITHEVKGAGYWTISVGGEEYETGRGASKLEKALERVNAKLLRRD